MTRWKGIAGLAFLSLSLGPSVNAVAAGAPVDIEELWARGYSTHLTWLESVPDSLAVSPDGSRVFVTGSSPNVNSSNPDFVTLAYDSTTGTRLWWAGDGDVLGLDRPRGLGISTDGQSLYVTGTATVGDERGFGTVAYDSVTGARKWFASYNADSSGLNDGAEDVAVSWDGDRVFVTGTRQDPDDPSNSIATTFALDAASGKRLWGTWTRAVESSSLKDLELSRDGSRLYATGTVSAGTWSQAIMTIAYDAETGRELGKAFHNTSLPDHSSRLEVSPDGTRVYVISTNEGRVYKTIAYDSALSRVLWWSEYHNPQKIWGHYALGLAVSPDGSLVSVTGSSEGLTTDIATVTYDAVTGAELWVSRFSTERNDSGIDLEYSSDGAYLYVMGKREGADGEYDLITITYDPDSGDQVGFVAFRRGHSILPMDLAVSPVDDRVFVTGENMLSDEGSSYVTIAYGLE